MLQVLILCCRDGRDGWVRLEVVAAGCGKRWRWGDGGGWCRDQI
ncbi:hypothetical protein HanRHA438_Chr03g0133941 [Helianthus annuus]|nr:hypothetical protein HanRHA438_Chr03g0133941 [Helianthus annuus]